MSILVATQLPDHMQRCFELAAPSAEFVRIPMGAPAVPDDVEILIAVTYSRDNPLPAQAPSWWRSRLKWLQLTTVGLDFYPDWFLHGGPVVTNGRGRSAVALAEFALAAIFAAAKKLPAISVDRPEKWQRRILGTVAGSTLGIIGFGDLAKALSPLAQALGMKVIATRRSQRPMGPGVERVADVADLFARSDHVVLAVPGNADTHHIVNSHVLAGARPGLHLINIARGSLIDDDALIVALDDGRVGLATLDTTAPEPLPAGHVFYSHPLVRLSPHSATNTLDNYMGLAERFARNLERYAAGKPLLDRI